MSWDSQSVLCPFTPIMAGVLDPSTYCLTDRVLKHHGSHLFDPTILSTNKYHKEGIVLMIEQKIPKHDNDLIHEKLQGKIKEYLVQISHLNIQPPRSLLAPPRSIQ